MARSSGTDATGTVKLEGDSKGLVISYKAAAKAGEELNLTLEKTSKSWDRNVQAAKRAQESAEAFKARTKELEESLERSGFQLDRATTGAKKMAPALKSIALGAAQGSVSLSSMAGAALSAANAFGPWGIAIGLAATALYTLASAHNEAEIAANRQRLALERLKLSEQSHANFERDEIERKKNRDKIEKDILAKGGHAAMRDALAFIEEDVVVAEARKEKHGALLTKQATVRADMLRLEAHAAEQLGNMDERRKLIAEADAILRADKLRALRDENTEEDKKTAKKREQLKLEKLITDAQFSSGLAGPNFRGQIANDADARKFAAGLADARGAGMNRGNGSDARLAAAQGEATGRLRDVEVQRGMQRDFDLQAELARIDQEKQALLSLADVKYQIATTGAERDAATAEREQIEHDARMQRIEAEQKAEDQQQGRIKKGLDFGKQAAGIIVGGLVSVSDARRQATRMARLQGKTEEEAAKAGKIAELEARAAQMKGIRDLAIVKSIDHTFEAIGAAARYDFVSAGLHAAAAVGFAALAGIAASRVKTLEGRADGMQGGSIGSGAAGGAANGPRGGAANTGPGPIDSSIPGSPTAKPHSQQSNASAPNHYHFHGDVLGEPQDEFVRKFDQKLSEVGHSRRRAS